MKIFLSWSGDCSKSVATALNAWLKYIFQNVDLWMSASSILPGSQWARKLDDELKNTNFGIICLSPENLSAPWILFEAGALSKFFNDAAKVVPYCIGLEPSEVSGPLAQFQGIKANEEGTLKLIKSINSSLEKKLEEKHLETIFSRFWPDLDKDLKKIVAPKGTAQITVRNVLCAYTEEFVERGATEDVSILGKYYPGLVTELKNVTKVSLRNALFCKQYEIVHLIGYVEPATGSFVFDTKDKYEGNISPKGLAELLKHSQVKLLVLATCDSLLLGATLGRHMSVISGFGSIKIKNILAWEKCFYEMLSTNAARLSSAYDFSQSTAEAPMILLIQNDAYFVPLSNPDSNS